MPSYRSLTAPQLVAQWKRTVNDNVVGGRDAHLFKEFLLQATAPQIILGMYQFEGNKTITIPLFLKVYNTWLELDEEAVDIELAVLITKKVPPEYYVWKERRQEQDPASWMLYNEARKSIRDWANKIIT